MLQDLEGECNSFSRSAVSCGSACEAPVEGVLLTERTHSQRGGMRVIGSSMPEVWAAICTLGYHAFRGGS